MRIIELRPETTPFQAGKIHRASSWRAEDYVGRDGLAGLVVRDVYHYSTLMVRFVNGDANDVDAWEADVLSTGHGSVSDQNGVNLLTSVRYVYGQGLTKDYGWRYTRRGGANVEYVGPETAVTAADTLTTWPWRYVSA